MMLTASHLAYAYDRRMVLEDLSLTLAAGESVALLGANGSGKSTLLRLLLGIHRPLRGQIQLGAEPLQSLSARERARRLAYVPQDHGAAFPFPVRDVVLMGRIPHQSLLGRASSRDRAAAAGAMERLGILAFADRPYTELSGGQRQLVLIARALAQEAPIMILDEPVTGLDYGNQHRLMAQIQDLAHSGYAILQSTHYPEHALAAASRVILLKDGRVLADGAPGEVLSPEHLHSLYGVKTEFVAVADGRRAILPILTKEPSMNPSLGIFASLTLAEPFQAIIQDFTASRPGVTVQPTYGFCGALMEKMAAGAAADVFAPSSEAMLAKAVAQGLAVSAGAVNYARNQLVLVSPKGQRAPGRLEDLADPAFARIALGEPEAVPPGRYGRMALEKVGLWQILEPRLQKYPDGIQPLKAVLEGRADAAFVFASTASGAAGELHILDITVAVSMHYPAAITRGSVQTDLARTFIGYLQSPPAQEILGQAGFSAPLAVQPSLNPL